jgi:hypothetical protein
VRFDGGAGLASSLLVVLVGHWWWLLEESRICATRIRARGRWGDIEVHGLQRMLRAGGEESRWVVDFWI